MWEMYSMGQQPYGGISNFGVKQLVENGERLKAPADCPENMYVVMKACWNETPGERPDFCELFEILLEVKRKAYSPSADYYTGTDASDAADIYTSDAFMDCRPVLREKRIKRLTAAGITVTEENVEELLEYMWGAQRNSDDADEDKVIAGPSNTVQQDEWAHDNEGYDVENITYTDDIILQLRNSTCQEDNQMTESSM